MPLVDELMKSGLVVPQNEMAASGGYGGYILGMRKALLT